MIIKTISDLRKTAKELDNKFFSRGAMEFFNSRIERNIKRVSDTAGYFITSEVYGDEPRHWQVRTYEIIHGRLEIYPTINLGHFPTKDEAVKAMKGL